MAESPGFLEMLPKQVCVVLLNTNSIDLVVLEFQVVHKDQSMAHFPASYRQNVQLQPNHQDLHLHPMNQGESLHK